MNWKYAGHAAHQSFGGDSIRAGFALGALY
jgi:hypothetical protein